jgi:hypothetical protein
MHDEVLIYRTLDDVKSIEVIFKTDTIWLTQEQISYLYGTKRSAITKHLKNIFNSGELNESVVCSILEQTTRHGAIKNKTQIRKVKVYNLDAIISVGYRVNSKEATRFRQWATQRLKDYLVKGYAINQKRLEENKAQFLQTLEDLKQLTQNNTHVETKEILTLIQNFSATFFALESYDKNEFPHQGNQKEIEATAQELKSDLQQLKEELIKKGEATELFAQEKQAGNLEGIFGNVFQTVFGQDAYPTVEEKAAHLL